MIFKSRRPGHPQTDLGRWIVVAGAVVMACGAPVREAVGAGSDASSPRRAEIETVDECFTGPEGVLPVLERPSPPPGRSDRLRLGDRRVPLEDVLCVRFGASETISTGSSTLYLGDGTELSGEVTGGDGDSLLWRTEALGEKAQRVSLDDVRGIVFSATPPEPAATEPQPPAGAAGNADPGGVGTVPSLPTIEDEAREDAIRNRLQEEIRARRPQTDVVVLREGGRLDGVYEGLRSGSIVFNSDSLGSVQLSLRRVRALFFASLEGEPEESRGEAGQDSRDAQPMDPSRVGVVLRDASYVPGRLQSWDAARLMVAHEILGDLEVRIPDVAEITFPGGRARFLSDMTPSSVREDAGVLFRLKMPHRNDASVVGTPLRIQGKEYRKGIGVHAFSLLGYPLRGEFRRFRATLGLDDTARPPSGLPGRETMGAVTFRVRLDGKQLFEKDMTWRDAPIPLDLPVASGKILELEVDFGDEASGTQMARDRANWAEARVIR